MRLLTTMLLLLGASGVLAGAPAALKDSVMEFGGFSPDATRYAYRLTRGYTDGSSKESWHLWSSTRTAPGLASPKGVRLEGQRFPAFLTREGYGARKLDGTPNEDRTSWTFQIPEAGTLTATLVARKKMHLDLVLRRPDGREETLGSPALDDIWFDLEATLHLAPRGRKAALVATFNGDIYRRSELFLVVLY